MVRRLIRWEGELASSALAQDVFRPELLRPGLETAPCFSTDPFGRWRQVGESRTTWG